MSLATLSAGLLLYRGEPAAPEVLLVHLGGPFWARRDAGAWFLPKGELGPDESPLAAARREFEEETGAPPPPAAACLPLGAVRQRGGKVVVGFAALGDFDPGVLRSNSFEMNWPPRSGRRRSFPEVDRAAWFTLEQARVKMHAAEFEFFERLVRLLA